MHEGGNSIFFSASKMGLVGYPHTWKTILHLIQYLVIFCPLKFLFDFYHRLTACYKSLFGVFYSDPNSKANLVEVRKILWNRYFRVGVWNSWAQTDTLHTHGGWVDAEDFIWRQENVFLHHIDRDGVTFLKTKKGTVENIR